MAGKGILCYYLSFKIFFLKFTNMLTMCFCGYVSNNTPMYQIMRQSDARHLKLGKQKWSNIKYLVKHVLRAAVFVNCYELEVMDWTQRSVIDIYVGVKHMLMFTRLMTSRKRRHKKIA